MLVFKKINYTGLGQGNSNVASSFAKLLALVFILSLAGCNSESKNGRSSEFYRKSATALFQRELYREALNVYEEYLNSNSIPEEDIPKVLYQMGNIYLENLKNPTAALARYTQLQALYPEENFNNQLGKKIVACLEKSGRNVDAKQALKSITDIEGKGQMSASGNIVAEIEDRKISLNEIEQVLGKLPEGALEQNQLISQYVSQILIAEAAIRKGLDQKAEVQKKIDFMRNQILSQESLKEELNLTPPSQNDLKYYFEANKAKFLTGEDSAATFEKLLPKIGQAWQMEKQNEKYQEYVQKLLQSDRVKIYGVSGKPGN